MACELNAPLAIIGAGTPKPMVPFFVIGIAFPNFILEIIGPYGFCVVPRNHDEMQKATILYWKMCFPFPGPWIQTYGVSRVLLITFFDVAEQSFDVFLPLCIAVRNEFELENIGDFLSLDYDEVREGSSISHLPCWFDNDMAIT